MTRAVKSSTLLWLTERTTRNFAALQSTDNAKTNSLVSNNSMSYPLAGTKSRPFQYIAAPPWSMVSSQRKQDDTSNTKNIPIGDGLFP